MDVKTAAREGNVGALKLLRDAKVTERESSDLVLLKFGSIVFWEVGVVMGTLNMTLILTSKRNIQNIRNRSTSIPPTAISG
jgi:hypothetical protein